MSNMLSELQWPTLDVRRHISRLTILYKSLHNLIILEIPTSRLTIVSREAKKQAVRNERVSYLYVAPL